MNASIVLPALHAADETDGKDALEHAFQQFGLMERNHCSFKNKDARIS